MKKFCVEDNEQTTCQLIDRFLLLNNFSVKVPNIFKVEMSKTCLYPQQQHLQQQQLLNEIRIVLNGCSSSALKTLLIIP